MIGVTIISKAHAGKGSELAEAWLNCAKRTLAHDPGCKSFNVMRSHDNPDQVLVFEVYGSKEELDAHNASDLSKELLPTLIPLVAGAPDIHMADLLTPFSSDSSR